jgi:hypothetical protein
MHGKAMLQKMPYRRMRPGRRVAVQVQLCLGADFAFADLSSPAGAAPMPT